MTVITNVSRRDLLKGGAVASGLVLGFHIGLRKVPFAEAAETPTFAPNAFLSIDETGLVTIVASRSEMGTGIKTDLPLVLADELDADWNRVKVVQAQGGPKYGDQNTDGSRSTWQFFGPMRVAGATARQMLENAAAQTWNVLVGECRAQNGFVVHASSGRKLAYGDLAKFAAAMPVPPSDQVRLKDRKDWRYIGKPRAIVDLKDIVRGRATYGIDVVVPGMKYASVERCPVYGGKVKSFDPKDALSVAGVERVVEIPATPMPSGFKPLGGVAVIANNTWSAQQGRQRLKIEWDYGPNAGHNSAAYRAELEATAKEPGKVVRNHGDVDGALASAVKRVSADYFVPHLAHAQMEVPNAVAHWVANTCETWSPTQNPTQVRQTVAQVLGINETDVTVNVTLLGGGFGRKSKPDYVAEAALLSRMVAAPVKVTWTREDDIQHDLLSRDLRAAPRSSARPGRPCQCVAASHRLPSDRGDIPAGYRLRQRRRAGPRRRRHALLHSQCALRERRGGQSCAHWVVPLGLQHPTCLRRLLVLPTSSQWRRQRTRSSIYAN
jgi:isoquinoline 1-oxidoreductase subunit beta